jgi:hypothetical protein
MCKHTSSSGSSRPSPTPPYSGGAMRQRCALPPREALLSASCSGPVAHPTPDLFPFGVLCAALRSRPVLRSEPAERENNYLTAPWRLWGFSLWLLWCLLGARLVPGFTSGVLLRGSLRHFTDMFELPTQRAMAARQNDRGTGKEGSFLHTISSAATPQY